MHVRVLLVDDHDDARTGLAQRLSRNERLHFVGAARDLAEAEAFLRLAQPDLVLVDIHRRDGRGIETCRALHRLTDAPLVVLTSFFTRELWDAAKEAGAVEYLLKNIDTGSLEREIIRLVERCGPDGATPT